MSDIHKKDEHRSPWRCHFFVVFPFYSSSFIFRCQCARNIFLVHESNLLTTIDTDTFLSLTRQRRVSTLWTYHCRVFNCAVINRIFAVDSCSNKVNPHAKSANLMHLISWLAERGFTLFVQRVTVEMKYTNGHTKIIGSRKFLISWLRLSAGWMLPVEKKFNLLLFHSQAQRLIWLLCLLRSE